MRKTSRRAFLALAGATALSACESNTVQSGKPPPSTAFSAAATRPKPKPVSLSQWYHPYPEPGVQEAVTRYAAAYQKSKVAVQWNPDDYETKLAAALQAGPVPDIFEGQVTLDRVRQNLLVPLDDVLAPVRGDFTPSVLAAQTVDGKTYGIPQALDIQVLFYRKSFLQEAGVRPPQTLDELVDAARKLSKDGVKGLFAGNDAGAAALAGPLLWAAGLDFVKDGKSVGFDDPRAATVFGKLRDLNGSLLLGAPVDWADPIPFIDGLAAMQWTWLANLPKIQDTMKDDVGVLPFPRLDAAGAASVPVSGLSAMVHSKSLNPNAAKDFVKWLWLERTDFQQEFATKFGFHLPARLSVLDKLGQVDDAARLVKENGRAAGPLWTPTANTALVGALGRIARDGADPATETKTAIEAVKTELGRLSA
ncbi:ABC transporter substrate-binding protein [Amycolatopsis regifaucium]|uniref:Sugar ABC transporter substrate-binding protein n=1 Tax=Amycolatopsis regifaucium TaxID=546365 RepID=A0A154MSP2_9PSEU|nr:extracellular solute-binding protein [Amycolatopsis regifaucium]KZB87348.1 sugar ABC transporter substrate-binding protein [Amycolatopsis regifaucium]OKA08182.1 sugar ABC transporter substrate-binding protein [Amycolatopsis regifaucium]SFI42575.1 carbohydrate ABC transporter substrate-binding protein, CUT1 family [Amycolatopsis regifaucium]